MEKWKIYTLKHLLAAKEGNIGPATRSIHKISSSNIAQQRRTILDHPSIQGSCIEKESVNALLLRCSTLSLGLVEEGILFWAHLPVVEIPSLLESGSRHWRQAK